jgi:HNH endonuclease
MNMLPIGPVPEKTAERFWSYVDRAGECWPWTGARQSNGYGYFKLASHTMRLAHRVAWAIEHGGLEAGTVVRHAVCDSRLCMRPAHLADGTMKDNTADMIARRRHHAWVRPDRVLRGERHPRAKLTWAQVCAIRRRHAAGEIGSRLAAEYGVCPNLIYAVVHHRVWKRAG